MSGNPHEEASSPQRPELYKVGYESYLSPFTSRYGEDAMRRIWSQESYWGNVRKVWTAAAEVQLEAGLVTPAQYEDLIKHQEELSVERILELEKEKGHDIAGAIAEYSEVAPIGGEILHQGMTSEDPLGLGEIGSIHESLDIIQDRLVDTLGAFAGPIDKYKDLVCVGYTHLQAAEPTTMGYRFAKYAQDLVTDFHLLNSIRPLIKAKGIRGAVGTSASFMDLLEGTGMTPRQHEEQILEKFGITAATIADQTYPRKNLYLVQNVLSNIGLSLHRYALDMQVLQSSFVGEVSEPRRKKQVGSSAMPHKQNPIHSENIDSLTEMLPGISSTAWITGAFVTLERTLRDSAGKRSWLPESFLLVDESLMRASRIMKGVRVHENAVKANLNRFAPYFTTEVIMNRLVQSGMDRQEAHERLVEHAEVATEAVRSGEPNPLVELVAADSTITSLIGKEAVLESLGIVKSHVGDAPERCTEFLEKELYPAIEKYKQSSQ